MKALTADFDRVLSNLEKEILTVLWPDKSLKVRDIYAKLKNKREVALSSVAVLLDRLNEKGVVTRRAETGRGGVRYIYTPRGTKETFHKTIVATTVDKLIAQFGPTAVTYFNERFGK